MVVASPGRGPGPWPRQQAPPQDADQLIETTAAAEQPPAKMVSRAMLICLPNSHPFQDRHLALEKPEKIGRTVARVRATPNNAIFDCKVLSRNHALIWYENGKFFLQDTKSSNGTFLNSQLLGKGSEESAPRELSSGDVVQFGVDILENSKKVTHGCIIATLKLFFPDGKEARASVATMVSSVACPLRSPELYQLQHCVEESLQRERSVESKLATLQKLMEGVRTATDAGWKALIDEDRLFTRLEMLEGQHALYSKNVGDDKLREEIARLQEDKNTYQGVAKECLKKVLHEKLEALRRLQELERSLTSTEEERRHQTQLRQLAANQLAELAKKYQIQLNEVADLETKVNQLEAKIESQEQEAIEAGNRWLTRNALQRSEEAAQRAQLVGLQTESDLTKLQLVALRQTLHTKLSDVTPNGDVGEDGGAMQQTEHELELVRQQLTAAETQLAATAYSIPHLKEDISKSETETAAFKEKTFALEAELTDSKTEVCNLKEHALQLEQELSDKEAELQKLAKQRSAGDTDIKDSNEAYVLELTDKVETLNKLLAESRRSRALCESRVERCESDLLVTRNNAQEATLRAGHLSTQLKEAECGLAVRSERQQQLQLQLVRLAASVTEAVQQLQMLQLRHDQQQQAAADALSRADRLQDSLLASEARLAESSREAESLRGEAVAAANAAERREAELASSDQRVAELEQRLSACTVERDVAVASEAALRSSASSLRGDGERAVAPAKDGALDAGDKPVDGGGGAEDAEKVALRRQLRTLDEKLQQLAVQNRTMDTSNMMAVAVLVLALFVTLLVMNS